MKSLFAIALIASVAGCAAFPEMDGKPVDAITAASLQLAQSPVWTTDFGDPGLRRMLAEADLAGLDVLAARARARSADLALAQQGRGGLPQISAQTGAGRDGLTAGGSLSFDPDLAGRLDAAIRAASLEQQASGLDVIAARRLLGREIVNGWVGLAAARTQAARANERITLERRALDLTRARVSQGEATAAETATRSQRLAQAEITAAESQGQIALAEARLRALGARSIPAQIPLRTLNRPRIPAQLDLAALNARPDVCAAWLRFHAADAARAETLRASRPRIAVSGSLNAAAKSLAELMTGNAAAIGHSVSIDGAILDGGQSRGRVDQARLAVAQAEIGWQQARSRAEIAALEAAVDLHGAEAQLTAALAAYRDVDADQARIRARLDGGLSDGLDLAEGQAALAAAQAEVDAARARAFRAAAAWAEAAPRPGTHCGPSA